MLGYQLSDVQFKIRQLRRSKVIRSCLRTGQMTNFLLPRTNCSSFDSRNTLYLRKRDVKYRKCNKVEILLYYWSQKIKQLWNLRHLLFVFWLPPYKESRAAFDILTTWRWSMKKDQNLFAVHFRTHLYLVCMLGVAMWSRNIITLTLYSKQISCSRLQKELCLTAPRLHGRPRVNILETNFWNFKNINTVLSTRNQCNFLVNF